MFTSELWAHPARLRGERGEPESVCDRTGKRFMGAIEVFRFHDTGHQIRTVLIDGEPWFVAADACRVLDLDVSAAMRRLDDDEYQQVDATLISNQGGARNV